MRVIVEIESERLFVADSRRNPANDVVAVDPVDGLKPRIPNLHRQNAALKARFIDAGTGPPIGAQPVQ